MDVPLPKLRPVEAFPVEIDGQQLVCLRDPLQFAAESLLVAHPAFFILTLLDGTRSMIDVQEAWTRRFGSVLESAQVRELLAALDGHHFLQSERFAAREAAVLAAFHGDSIRRAAHAGASYPDDPEALRRHLAGFFTGVAPTPPTGVLRGLVAPHIDLRVGGTAYGHAYAALPPRRPTAHGSSFSAPPTTPAGRSSARRARTSRLHSASSPLIARSSTAWKRVFRTTSTPMRHCTASSTLSSSRSCCSGTYSAPSARSPSCRSW
jgi:hypothetical protein